MNVVKGAVARANFEIHTDDARDYVRHVGARLLIELHRLRGQHPLRSIIANELHRYIRQRPVSPDNRRLLVLFAAFA